MTKNFTFKQFHINAYQCGMPVSTDAVLLGAWADIEHVTSILDIGSGTGILSLMAAQRNDTAEITAVEIEINAFNATKLNFVNSPWAKRLHVKHVCIEGFVETGQKFSSIICNPPYFNSGEMSINEQRATARHTQRLTHLNLINICESLLIEKGLAHLILPKKEGQYLIEQIKKCGRHIQLVKVCHVQTTANKDASRVLMSFIKSTQSLEVEVQKLVIHKGTGYSQPFINLTQAFYLKM